MKRKIIQIADSTQLISIPRKWAKYYNLKKGDEVEVVERKGQIVILPGGAPSLEKIEVDVTGLDRTSILLLVRSLYRKGFEEIKIICNTPLVPHFRVGTKKTFLSVVHTEVNRLPGVEVIEQKENFCIIRAISEPTLKDIDQVSRRLLLLISDAAKDVISGARDFDEVLLDTIEEKHDSISKFTSYCLRLLNKEPSENQISLYTIVYLLDKVMDYIKNTARICLHYKKKLQPDSIQIMNRILETIILYENLHFKTEFAIVNKISREKEEIHEKLISMVPKLPRQECFILETFESTLELYRGIMEIRLGMS